MVTGRNLSMSGINSGHNNLPTYEMSLKSDNVEFVRYCGGHLGFPTGIKNTNFVEDLPMIIPGQFGFNYPSGHWTLWENIQMPSTQKLQI
jgi:hypothetical protein